jgi:acyl-CoA reductase-like NAD-dependent aldehyde dehydrogenase
MAGTRLFLHDDVHDEIVERLVAHVRQTPATEALFNGTRGFILLSDGRSGL